MQIVFAVYGVMSVVTYIAFWLDKRKSINGDWRTPEMTLHALEFLGGWPGALLAMRVVRHKNSKFSFYIVTCLIIVLHALGWWLALR